MVKALKEEWSQDEVKRKKVGILLPSFRYEEKKLLYRDNLCVPRKSVSKILELEHDSNNTGHFRFDRTMSRLEMFRWIHKSRNVKSTCRDAWSVIKSKIMGLRTEYLPFTATKSE